MKFLPYVCGAIASSILAVILAHLTYALGMHDDAQLTGLFLLGFVTASYTAYVGRPR